MKKTVLFFALIFMAIISWSQISISNLPTYTASPVSGYIPIVFGGQTKKIDVTKITGGFDSTKVAYLAKNNKFTGKDSFPNIYVGNGDYSSGLSTQGDSSILGKYQSGSGYSSLIVDDHNSNVTLHYASLVFWNNPDWYIDGFSGDETMSDSSTSYLPTQSAVKAYVDNKVANVSVPAATWSQVVLNGGNDTTHTTYTSVVPTDYGSILYITGTHKIGDVMYFYNDCSTWSHGNYTFRITKVGAPYFYLSSEAPTGTSVIVVDSGKMVRVEFVSNYKCIYTIQDQVAPSPPTLPYTEYTALLYQSGTNAPIDTSTLINTTGHTFTFSYVSQGIYTMNISGSTVPRNKVFYSIGNGGNGGSGGGTTDVTNFIYYIDSNYFVIKSRVFGSGSLTDAQIRFTPITIRIYN